MQKKLGDRLIEAGLVTQEAIAKALEQQKITGHRLGDCLVELGLIPESALLKSLAQQFNTRFVVTEKLAKANIEPAILEKLPVRIAETQLVLPISLDAERGILAVVMAEPQNEELRRELALVAGVSEVVGYVGLRRSISAAIKKLYYGDPTAFTAPGQASRDAQSSSAVTRSNSGTIVFDSGGKLQMPDPRDEGRSAGRLGASPPAPHVRDGLGSFSAKDYSNTLGILVELLESERGNSGHSSQLARHASTLATRLGMSPREGLWIAMAASLHALGEGPHLTLGGIDADPKLREEAKRSYLAPVNLLEGILLPVQVNRILAQRYEAYDGSGLPMGAKGEDIARGARIIAVVDAYLELTRSEANGFGRRLDKREALAHLTEEAGRLYDPEVVGHLGRLLTGDLLRMRVEGDGRQVLIVESEENPRMLLGQALAALGLVTLGVNSLEGVEGAIEHGEGEVLVMALRLGATELLSVIQYIRCRPETAGVPVVILGSPPDAASRERLLQPGNVTLIALPTAPQAQAEEIARIYHQRIQNGAPGQPVRGSFDELGPRDLAKALSKGKKSGRLTVRAPPTEGVLYLEEGRVVAARCTGTGADAAVDAIFALPHADFLYEPDALWVEVPQTDRALEPIGDRPPS